MKKLIKLRERFNLSRKDLSGILGRPIKFIVDVENGKDSLRMSDVKTLCDQFDLKSEFFYDTNDKPSSISEWDAALGRNVKYYRELNGMTQQILAEELGYAGAATISGIERGIKPIGKKSLLRLADLFDIHISELFNYNDPSVAISQTKVLGMINFVLNHDRRPGNWDCLLSEIEDACKELSGS